ncbi:MAG: helix-turn-helix transcriptional regulator [Candidatus Aminicenantes bacterium]|nr:helix-turn-helix transcriptional regulator [Candidatus Aminicenantes bacterium]
MGRKRIKKEDKPKYYHISTVSRMYNLHPQTLRLYEREGLIKPSRSQGNTRLYTDEDLKQLELILTLVRDLGVNLAGVEVILNLRRKIEKMEAEVNELLEFIKKEFFGGKEEEFEKKRKSLVPVSSASLIKVEKLEKVDES